MFCWAKKVLEGTNLTVAFPLGDPWVWQIIKQKPKFIIEKSVTEEHEQTQPTF